LLIFYDSEGMKKRLTKQAFTSSERWIGLRLNRRNAHFFAVTFDCVVPDNTVSSCEKREVPAASDIGASEDGSAYLTNDDAACSDNLSVVYLDASVLRVGVATVSGTTTRFLMCH
jgi:hypothetical protein